ncbi:MAG: S8 family serine peptidase [Clostridia bacterium]|nr:S8 family serine peptidase [Clostridia bacterium]MDD4376089.1 S8 family serine peptidase [Clostridia bacterium]
MKVKPNIILCGKLTQFQKEQNVDIDVGTDSNSFIMYMWNNPSDRLSVSVKSPTGEVLAKIPAKNKTKIESKLILEKSTVIVEYFFPIEQSGDQLTMIRILDPTPGIWRLTVFGDILLEGNFHVWLPATGLISPNIHFIESSPNYTITLPATSIGGLVLGAYNAATNSLLVSSSWGPTRLPAMSPDLVAPGVNVSGLFPYGYGNMSGTSVSSAITTGAAALVLQWGIKKQNDPLLNTFRLRTFFINGAIRDPYIIYPNPEYGFGKLNLLNTFNTLKPI